MKEFKYSADGDSLMLGTEAFKAHYSNYYGDGDFTVYIDENGNDPDNWKDNWKYVDSVEGQFNVYDCDTKDAEVLTTLEGRYGIYGKHGDMLLVKWN